MPFQAAIVVSPVVQPLTVPPGGSIASIVPATINGVATVTATVQRTIVASINGTSTVSATVVMNPRRVTPATINGAATVTASVVMNPRRVTPATVNGAATVTGSLVGKKALSGTSTGSSAVSATVRMNPRRITPATVNGTTSFSANPTNDYTQSQLQGSPWFWVFVGAVPGGQAAYRFQMDTRVELLGPNITRLLTMINSYEKDLVSKSVPVSVGWGQLYGPTTAYKRQLRNAGEE